MPNRRIHAAVAVLGIVAACGLVLANRGPIGTEATLVAVRSADDEATVVIHLTGLVLVVPPAQDGGRTDVLLPTITEHAALLGFGVTGDEPFVPRLCRADAAQSALRAGVCYVDLDRWQLEPFGQGGHPTPAGSTLPPGVLNTTRASGGGYGVHVAALGGELRAQVAFAAGRAGGQCSLASWTYEPAGARGDAERLPLAYVLDWEIRSPAARTLVFRSRSGEETITVPLPAPDADGKVELVLAHVPVEELGDLPPARAHSAAVLPDTAHHVDAFYNLLRDRGTHAQPLPNSPNRRLPHSPTVLRPSGCDVAITVPASAPGAELPPFASTLALTGNLRAAGLTATRPLSRGSARVSVASRAGTKTYGCVVGGGERF